MKSLARRKCDGKWQSLPSRGAWIEMKEIRKIAASDVVAPLTGSVDLNAQQLIALGKASGVAPLTGSVD